MLGARHDLRTIADGALNRCLERGVCGYARSVHIHAMLRARMYSGRLTIALDRFGRLLQFENRHALSRLPL